MHLAAAAGCRQGNQQRSDDRFYLLHSGPALGLEKFEWAEELERRLGHYWFDLEELERRLGHDFPQSLKLAALPAD